MLWSFLLYNFIVILVAVVLTITNLLTFGSAELDRNRSVNYYNYMYSPKFKKQMAFTGLHEAVTKRPNTVTILITLSRKTYTGSP